MKEKIPSAKETQIFFQKPIDKSKFICYNSKAQLKRKLSSVGRASALQAEGQGFEPLSFHHWKRVRPILF